MDLIAEKLREWLGLQGASRSQGGPHCCLRTKVLPQPSPSHSGAPSPPSRASCGRSTRTLSTHAPHAPDWNLAVHPVAEVRGRTLQSLEFKWKYGLIGPEDLLADRRVLAALLREWRPSRRPSPSGSPRIPKWLLLCSCLRRARRSLVRGIRCKRSRLQTLTAHPLNAHTTKPRHAVAGRWPAGDRRRHPAAAQARRSGRAPRARAARGGRRAAAARARGRVPARDRVVG